MLNALDARDAYLLHPVAACMSRHTRRDRSAQSLALGPVGAPEQAPGLATPPVCAAVFVSFRLDSTRSADARLDERRCDSAQGGVCAYGVPRGGGTPLRWERGMSISPCSVFLECADADVRCFDRGWCMRDFVPPAQNRSFRASPALAECLYLVELASE